MTKSRMGIWKVVQEAGRAEHRRCEQDREAMFERGEMPEGCTSSQEKAVIEVSGILVGGRPEAEESQIDQVPAGTYFFSFDANSWATNSMS